MRKLTLKQKRFADSYLETKTLPDGIKREDFDAVVKWLKKNNNINLTTESKDLYFIRCRETKRIKIGITRDIVKRFYDLDVFSPTNLELLLVIDFGGMELERHLHNRFKKYQYKGEWFESNKELEDMIIDMIKLKEDGDN